MVLGSSLAHGIAKKCKRDGLEKFNGRLAEVKQKVLGFRVKRAAKYRYLQEAYNFLYQQHGLFLDLFGDKSGKDKKAWFLFFGVWPKKVEINKTERIIWELTGHKESAKDPRGNFDVKPGVIFGDHAVARYFETYDGETDFAKILRNNRQDVDALIHAHQYLSEKINLDSIKDNAVQLYGNRGVIRCLWIPENNVLEVKTIISYDAMPPEQAKEYRALISTNHVSQWRNYHK